MKICGPLFIEEQVSWEAGTVREKELSCDFYTIQRAWPQPCLTEALRVACRGKKKIGLVNTHVTL